MVLYTGGQRGRPAGQAVVTEVSTVYCLQVEDAIDVYFKRLCGGEEVMRAHLREPSWRQTTTPRINRSRPVIPPLLELHLIQLGNKLTIGEAEVARVRFRRAAAAATLGPSSGRCCLSSDSSRHTLGLSLSLSLHTHTHTHTTISTTY
ncbi:hypothetical protein Hamer_G023169 [Homarus americanus]|uniref:Uncharacterized protein n=1 Tax=Homarus americanus TaxID=6706 RepID=A0A8J5MPU8_HOMAM|nr:hypothetical protein Hamer_G023169 [Homarus americanus]